MYKLNEELYKTVAGMVVAEIAKTVHGMECTLIDGVKDCSVLLTMYMDAISSEALFDLTFRMMRAQANKARKEAEHDPPETDYTEWEKAHPNL